jgi:hypothetical protein
VGGGAAAQALLAKFKADILPKLDRILLLSKQLAFIVLRLCCLPKLHHWLRLMPPAQTQRTAELLDKWILDTLAKVVEVDKLTPEATQLAGLPLREQGLGLYPQVEIAGFAHAASVVAARATLLDRVTPGARPSMENEGEWLEGFT